MSQTRTFLFAIFDGVHLVYSWPEVGRVTTESDLKGGKEAIHASQQ